MVEFSKIVKKQKRDEPQRAEFPEKQENKNLEEQKRVLSQHPPANEQKPVEPVINDEAREPDIKPVKSMFTNRRFEHTQEAPVEHRKEGAPDGQARDRQPVLHVAQVQSSGDSSMLYEKLFKLAKNVFSKGVDYSEVDTSPIVSVIAEVAGAIAAGDEKLVELALVYILKEEEYYLHQHSVNVCVISLKIGSGAGFEMGRLVELGLAAFFHDIGMTQFEDMVNMSRKLTDREYEEIKSHVSVGDVILKKINHGLSDTIIAAHNEIHERLDGSGYPFGKKSIHDYARIIAVADAFESMIHPRPFRPRYSIMDVYKRIFEQKNKYDQTFIKILVDRVGFFPNGSFVQLNTREVGKVVAQNPRSPLRPVVKILYSEDGHQLYEEETKDLNLTKYPTIHVKKCFLEESDR